jgi:hypothetical protein
MKRNTIGTLFLLLAGTDIVAIAKMTAHPTLETLLSALMVVCLGAGFYALTTTEE